MGAAKFPKAKSICTTLLAAALPVSGLAQDIDPRTLATRAEVQDMMDQAQSMGCRGTNDGYDPAVMGMPSDGLYQTFHVRFGQAEYTEDGGYRTYLDITQLPKASPLLRAFVIAHECAHHSLGQTYEAYDLGFIPAKKFFKHEDDADCEGLRTVARQYDLSTDDKIEALFEEFESVNRAIILGMQSISAEEQADMLNALPERSAARLQKALNCPLY